MTVHLVGAGPGDADLLTVRAQRLLSSADVVVHDRLVGRGVLAVCAPTALVIDVGKIPGQTRNSQVFINQLLIEYGRTHETVVRLKGGDPFVFGRGAEEAEALRAGGLEVEVVPGLSSAIAGPAVAGIPVTHRGHSSGFTVVTAHQDPVSDRLLDWDALARLGTTLVILMGASRAASIRSRLLRGGMDPGTPVAIVTAASRNDQQVTRLQLAELGDIAVRAPSIIVVGAVAALDVLDAGARPELDPALATQLASAVLGITANPTINAEPDAQLEGVTL